MRDKFVFVRSTHRDFKMMHNACTPICALIDHILDGEKEKTQIKLSNNTTVYMVILASQQVCSKWQNDDG